MTISNSTITSVESVQAILSTVTALSLTASHFPSSLVIEDDSTYDFIIVGSGAGGSTVASRLTEDEDITVALIEAGSMTPLESTFMGLFPTLVNSAYEWNVTSKDDSYANQALIDNVVGVTVGHVAGGSSTLDHAIKVSANKYDFERFVAATGDDVFSLDNMLPYFIKSESLRDEDILAAYPTLHGTDGPLIVTRETSDKNTNILASFEELGNELVLDINANVTLGYTEPTLLIGDVWRQSAAESYLGRAKNRSNLYLQLEALVTKININSSNLATGVTFLTSDGTYKTIYARKEVIVSAGAIKSPQLLMLSGIGNKTHLEENDIDVIADLPVGDYLMDHVSNVVGIAMEETTETSTADYSKFPTPMTTGYVSLDGTKDPTYQTINLLFEPGSAGLLQLCVFVFKYNNTVCTALYESNVGNNLLFSVVNLMHPNSTGTVRLASTDPTDNPEVYLRHLSSSEDLENLALALMDVAAVVNTTYFKNISAAIVDIDLPACEDYETYDINFWRCYAKAMSATMWHYSSTCAIGKVLDSDMVVKGVDNLRVVDASAMPYTVTGNIVATIYALAEYASALIKTKYGIS